MASTDTETTIRYLQYECTYRACKYKEPLLTWGEIYEKDYPHFLQLLSTEVPLDSYTFEALSPKLTQEDLAAARSCTRTRDTVTGKKENAKKYLEYECGHKGKMNGKTWGEILRKHYRYFGWSVGNAMGRDTSTFKNLSEFLDPVHLAYVLGTPKGDVKMDAFARNKGNKPVPMETKE